MKLVFMLFNLRYVHDTAEAAYYHGRWENFQSRRFVLKNRLCYMVT